MKSLLCEQVPQQNPRQVFPVLQAATQVSLTDKSGSANRHTYSMSLPQVTLTYLEKLSLFQLSMYHKQPKFVALKSQSQRQYLQQTEELLAGKEKCIQDCSI